MAGAWGCSFAFGKPIKRETSFHGGGDVGNCQSLDSLAARMELKKPPSVFEKKETLLYPTLLALSTSCQGRWRRGLPRRPGGEQDVAQPEPATLEAVPLHRSLARLLTQV